MARKNMRLLVLGDENVGKSSLIQTIYSQVSSNVEKTLKKVILPPQMCLYSKEVFTELVDTSVEMDITADVRASDLVLLIYDVSDPETIARIETDWLPKINSINPKIPIILVGNKMDKKQLQFESENQYIKIKDILKKVTRKFKNVQMGIQCSAFYDRNVKSVLNCAQRAVLYPLHPLYNLEEKKITSDFRKALIRIFRILDQDYDGRLHDSQLNVLQQRVFQGQLNAQDIKAIKQIILRQLEVEQHDFIDLKGFIALQKKVIQMLKIQICWSILRYFGYNDKLRINVSTDHFKLDQNSGQSAELSSEAINFLMKIYNLCKKGVSIEQSQQKMEEPKGIIEKIFEPCPEIQFEEFANGKSMEQQKFLTTWNMYAFIDYKKCYEYLLYLGYQNSIQQAFNRRKSKKSYNDFQRIKDNKVFSVLIVDNGAYTPYLDQLFCESTKVEINKMSNNPFTYQRTSILFTNQNISKTFLLFRTKINNLSSIFNEQLESQASFVKRIDLIMEFEKSGSAHNEKNIQQMIPNFMLYRKVTQKQCQQILNTQSPPKLDLTSMPIRFQQKFFNPLFCQVIMKVIQNIQQGLTKDKINQLKVQKQHKKNIMLLSTLSIGITLFLLGTFVFKKFNVKG